MNLLCHREAKRVHAGAILILLSVWMLPMDSAGQSAQRMSLQVSGLGSLPFGGGLSNVSSGVGWEAQIRWTPGSLSWGAGAEQTFHTVVGNSARTVTLLGGFLEPRYVIYVGSDAAAPYLSGRFAMSSVTVKEGGGSVSGNGLTINGGGGLLIRLGGRTNLDLGVTVGFKKLGTVTIADALFDMGNGINLITRIGLAFGLGS